MSESPKKLGRSYGQSVVVPRAGKCLLEYCKDNHAVYKVLIFSRFSHERPRTLIEVLCIKIVLLICDTTIGLYALSEASLAASPEKVA